jgi:iron complex outermembrane receptor protein
MSVLPDHDNIESYTVHSAISWPDTVKITGVTIASQKNLKATGFAFEKIDSLSLVKNSDRNLGELLKENSNVYIKTYGQGSLATPSFRGTGASHTQVLWNGQNINSPMLGQTDFSLVPVFFADAVTVFHGGGSLYTTSGGIGGSIAFENLPAWASPTEATLNTSMGSYGLYNVFSGFRTSIKKIHLSTRIFHSEAVNNFSYKNTALSQIDPPTERRSDAGYKQNGLMQEVYFQANSKNLLSLKTWLQQTHRQIPQPMVVQPRNGNEFQDQKFIRTIASWDYFGKKINLNSTVAWFYEDFYYRNIISEIVSQSFTNSFQVHASAQKEFKKVGNLTLTAIFENHNVHTNNYINPKTRTISGIVLNFTRKTGQNGELSMNIRKEMVNQYDAPLLPSLGYTYYLSDKKSLYLKANLSRNYNYPSLNDLYWNPGGNPDLVSENGYTGEAGIGINTKSGYIKNFSMNLTTYYASIDDWIIWQPDAVFSYWTPQNIRKVNSHGIEFKSSVSVIYKTLNAKLSTSYTYTVARNKYLISPDDLSYNKQLIYTPLHAFNSNLHVACKSLFTSYGLEVTGKRFTTSDNSRFMPAYGLHNLALGVRFHKLGLQYEIQFNVNNILNSSYQSIAWQPMPGRNYRLSLKIKFTKNE